MCNLCLNRVTHKISTLTLDSTKPEKSGSQPIAKRTYCFTCENGTVFILPCISDRGNVCTFVTQDILDDNVIAYYEADADEHLIDPNGSNMHIRRCILIVVSLMVSCYDSRRIGAITIAYDDWSATVSLANNARICAIYKDVPFRLAPMTIVLQ